MRFLADMGTGFDVVAALRAQGNDALHLRERNWQRIEHDEIVVLAISKQRIILTHDLDFSRIVALSGAASPSIITFRLSDMRPANDLSRLLPILAHPQPELLRGAMITVTDGAVRIRLLPIGSAEEA